jgi:hypothetical protein
VSVIAITTAPLNHSPHAAFQCLLSLSQAALRPSCAAGQRAETQNSNSKTWVLCCSMHLALTNTLQVPLGDEAPSAGKQNRTTFKHQQPLKPITAQHACLQAHANQQ